MPKRITEQESNHHNLEHKSTRQLLEDINLEDQSVPNAVAQAISQIEALVNCISDKLLAGGRLFYLGAGTSGRLGIVDASECPPTFGVPHELVIGLIAGGDSAIRKAVEFAEDDTNQGWLDLKHHQVSSSDVVVGIAASGSTPYVIGALQKCQENGIKTGSISCNPHAKISAHADFPIEVIVGPEFISGSTRMKAGTAQKLVLNMISTSVMIKLGRVQGNRMVDMQLSNDKLVDRGTTMILDTLPTLSHEQANELLLKHGSVRKAIEAHRYGR